ncbi:MAG: DNA internalization-related competence protein ComEC/Rec2 [Gammaproteobacteria bacterium]|nr:DNA internalization-related competence protein ComEC/Rec2 [Gammaproteobacteria bacterium]
MAIAVSLFAAGIWLLYQLSTLPGWAPCLLAAVLAALLAQRPVWRYAAAFLAGFAWAGLHALSTLPPELPDGSERGLFDVQGRVSSLVSEHEGLARFVLDADSLATAGESWDGSWRLRLTWREAPPLLPGQPLALSVRLKHVHGFASPGAWDYEGWLIWRGIRFTGYVIPGAEVTVTQTTACCRLDRLRARLSARVDALPLSESASGIIRALTIGDRSGLSSEINELFRTTGTSHLMAISGLHIGLVAGLGLLVTTAVWRRIAPFAARVPAPVAGAVAALVLGASYAILAGMTLPTQRAMIMLAVLAVGIVRRRPGSISASVALAAFCVLCWHPPAILGAGFWLSFGAVVVIIAVMRHIDRGARMRAALGVQLALSLALWPILALFDMPAAIGAPLANIVLVPLFGFLIVPTSLLGVVLLALVPGAGAWLLGLLDPVLAWVMEGLSWIALGDGLIDLAPARDGWALLAVLICLVAVLAPRGFPMRRAVLPLLLVPWLPRQPVLEPGDFAIDVLDVGQGLSVVVRTRQHTLVFDTGPAYASGFATSRAVLLPFLSRKRVERIDRLVLSHGDLDHAGGVAQLRSGIDVLRIDSGEPERVGNDARICRGDESWQWDGVLFRYLHPPPGADEQGNNASCVLRISGRGGSVLLTGDIERKIERRLVAAAAAELASDIVIAPHHGSRSSSSAAFIDAVAPDYVVYTTGWGNRYGFPAAEVDRRWRGVGAVPLDTASAGTVSFVFDTADSVCVPTCHRVHAGRFWWHRGGSAEGCHAVSSRGRRISPERASSSSELSAKEEP